MTNPFFNVRKEDLVTESGIALDNKVALINDDTNEILGTVSRGYELVYNQVISDLFDSAFTTYKKSMVKDHLDATGKRWKRQIVFDTDELNFDIDKKGDMVGLMIEIVNGYDGSTSYGFDIVGYRYLCENGVVMGRKNLLSERFYHFNNNSDQLLLSFESKFSNFKDNVEVWKRWTEIPFTKNQFNDFVESREYLSDKMQVTVSGYYDEIMNRFNENETMWGTYNVLTAISTHKTKARKGSNIFSNRYKTINKLETDFYGLEKTPLRLT